MLKLPSDDEVEAALAALPAAGHGLTVLPHWAGERAPGWRGDRLGAIVGLRLDTTALEITRAADRKSTRLNSSHGYISYAVFCLKKKKKKKGSRCTAYR